MSLALLISGDGRAALTASWRIPRTQVESFASGLSLLKEGDRRLARVATEIEAEKAAAQQDGFAAGHAEGLRAATAETAGRLAQIAADAARDRAEVHARMGRLALDVVRRLAGELGSDQLTPAMVERAVREILPDQPVQVRVAPSVRGLVETRLWAINGAIDVVADDRLGETDCVLETASGRVQAGLEAQLSTLERAFAGGAA